jgi:nitronate monooxygenase
LARRAEAPYYDEFGLDIGAVPAGPGRVPFSAEAAELLAEFRPPVVSFHFGLPAPELLARVKSWGAFVLSSATSVREALWLQEHGADAVIAQGLEAGGHRGHFLSHELTEQLGTFALLPQVVAAVRVPVITAGGIADAAGVRAARALAPPPCRWARRTCAPTRPPPRPCTAPRCKAHAARHTAVTNCFTGRPARGIVNRVMRELGPISPAAPEFPWPPPP